MYEEKTQNLSVSFSRTCPFRFRGYTVLNFDFLRNTVFVLDYDRREIWIKQ